MYRLSIDRMGWCPAGVGSMTLRRRWAIEPWGPSQSPASSGPRWVRRSRMDSMSLVGIGDGVASRLRMETKPHMGVCIGWIGVACVVNR